jgi:Ca-activated chloride channel family protein
MLAVPLLVGLGLIGRARRRRDWAVLGQPGRPAGEGWAGWVAAAVCLVVALAQPRWGNPARSPLPPGHDVVVAVDVSRSMGCGDVVPDRLGRAVELASGLVEELGSRPGDRVAVVAFAGRAVAKCPLTTSLGAVLERLRSLRPGDVRPGGTDLAAALDGAADAFDDQEHTGGRVVVILSDGEDHPAAWPAALARLRERDPGVVVHAVAISDQANGHPVPLRPRSGPGFEPLRYQGEVVASRRTDLALEAIATATGGAFLPLGLATADLGRLYRERIEPVALARRAGSRGSEPAERYGVFVLAALGLGLAASRPGWHRSGPGRGGVFLAALAAVTATAGAGPQAGRLGGPSDAASPARLVAAGRAAFDAGRFHDALVAFTQAAARAPSDPIPRYDVAAAAFQLGLYAQAFDDYSAARPRADAALRTRIDYALGNTALALGDLAGAIRHYDDCLASTAPGPPLDEVRRRAAANRKFVEDLTRQVSQPSGSGPAPRPSGRPKGGDASGEPGPGDRTAPPPPGLGDGSTPPSAPRRGPGGGAGSARSTPPAPGSLEDRLDSALENIREALHHRLDEPPAAEESRDTRDW